AALHILTLGMLAATAMGAALQLLPVATRQAIPARWPARLAFWLLVPGTLMTVHGMATATTWAMALGGAMAALALAMLGVLIALNLMRARDLGLVAAHGQVAIASLFGLLALGLLLVFNFAHGFLPDHRAIALVHVIVAGYGFMGMFVVGFSQILVPMFALAASPDRGLGRAGLWLAVLGLGLGVAGVLGAVDGLVVAAIVSGLAASAAHLTAMARVMRNRMRKRLGLSFVLIRAAWGLLPLSLVIGLLQHLELLGERGGTLFVFVLFAGWLLTMLLGILQRILPFLATMHPTGDGGRMPTLSQLTAEGPLKVSTACHLLALLVSAVGIIAGQALVLRLGAGFGLVGALAFALFAAPIFWRLIRGRARTRPGTPPGPARPPETQTSG
ncbi:MAG: hypothetical protein OEQ29_08875, partial [Alphaproteobacteria bacterium]|nr:hypothetical protein [Alphaproteobacteria bacterium]